MKSRVIQTGSSPQVATDADRRAIDQAGPTEHHDERGVAAVIRRHPLVSFFLIAFGLTWVTVPLGTFMAAGPLIAALVVIGVADGREGLRGLWTRVTRWRVGWQWYAAAVLVPIGLAFAAGGLNVAFGATDAPLVKLELTTLALTFATRMVFPLFAPIAEEPAWRGFALPRLQARHSPFTATLILGLVVAVWHVPLVFLSTEHLEPVMLLATVAVTFFYTWLFNHTGGSVFITIVAHAAEGLVTGELLRNGGFHGADEAWFSVIYTIGRVVVAIVLLVADRKMWRSAAPRPAVAAVPASRVGTGARVVAATVVAASAFVLLAGVAGADGSTKAPDPDTYIDRADHICQVTIKKTDPVIEDLGFSPSDSEARAAVDDIIVIARDEIVDLRDLTPPKGDAAEVARIYDAMERGFDRVEAKPSRLFDEPGPFARSTHLAADYGMDVCGRG